MQLSTAKKKRETVYYSRAFTRLHCTDRAKDSIMQRKKKKEKRIGIDRIGEIGSFEEA